MKIANRTDTTSMDASFNGAAFGLDGMVGFSIQGTYTESSAALSGTIKLQASNNAILDNPTAGTENPDAVWEDIDGADVTLTTGSGTFFFNVSDVYYRAFRVVWTRTDGEGSLTTYTWAKGFV